VHRVFKLIFAVGTVILYLCKLVHCVLKSLNRVMSFSCVQYNICLVGIINSHIFTYAFSVYTKQLE